MAKAKASKSRQPAKAKATAKTKIKAKIKAKIGASPKRAAPARKSAAASRAKPVRKAAAKKPAARKPVPKKLPAKKLVVKKPAARRRPAPALVPSAIEAVNPVANMGDSEPADDDEPQPQSSGIREAVASFATQGQFREAVKRLLAAGFAPTDLSILASHDSLEVAGGVPGYRAKPGESLMAGLTEEASLLAPLQVAGFSALSGGPIAGAVAALVTAGIGALGLRDVVERFVANRHGNDYVEALKSGGVLLWVRVADARQEWQALDILVDRGGRNAHINVRPAGAAA